MGAKVKAKILTLLKGSSDYLSGQELCDRFGVSRTAVWKAVKQLKEEGYRIEAVQNKGYKLLESPDVLSEAELKNGMNTVWAGQTLCFLEKTGSTNVDAKRLAEEGAPHGTLVVADFQESGRGRRGRQWQAPAGCNVYFTIVLRPELSADKASMLTLVMALSVAKAITAQSGLKAGIKWPNDIVVNRKKVCGILTEMTVAMEEKTIQYVVIGVGINVNQKEFPDEIKENAGSLSNESGKSVPRAGMIQKVMEFFEKDYEAFLTAGDMSGIMEAYNCLLVNKDRQVKVLDPKDTFEGTARGIDKKGDLLVERENGSVEAVYAGEVSVRGLYGYV